MTLYMEDEAGAGFSFSAQDIAELVCRTALEAEGCPYEAQVNLILTDDAGIRELNREMRGIDRATDVLSFPNVDFEEAGVFGSLEEREADYFDPVSYTHLTLPTILLV